MTPKNSSNSAFSLRLLGGGLMIAAITALPLAASAATIGVNFLAGANVGGTNGNALLSTDTAGAFPQANWNNLAVPNGTNVAVFDSAGVATPVIINWASPNTWSQSGNTTVPQLSPDANMMNGYLDNNGNANVALQANMFSTAGNNNRNYPLVYLSGMQAWMASQGVSAYDVVIYSDGDNNGGRVGEFWAIAATGASSALTYGADMISHVFICDRNNFISQNQTYLQAPLFVQDGITAEFGNFPANYTVLTSLTNDSVLLRSQRFNSRAPINGIQILPRATPVPATVSPVADAKVFSGATARFSAIAAGRPPFAYQWQKNGVNLSDAGNISGSLTPTLNVANAGPGDVAAYTLVVSNVMGFATSSVAQLTISAPVANTYAEKVVTNGPYAYWRLNDVVDATTNFAPALDYAGKFTGVYGNGAQNGYNSVPGPQPSDFPGFLSGNFALQTTSASIRTWVMAPPLNLNTNTVTMCAWIYPTAPAEPGACGLIFSRLGSDVAGLGYGNNNNLGYTWNSNSSATYGFVSGLVVPSNQWSFVALAVSPSNAILYVYNTNGQLSATNTLAHTVEAFTGLTFIGVDAPNSVGTPQSRSFIGSIDEAAVFNRTLPPSEVFNLYKKGLGLDALVPVIAVQPASEALFSGRRANFNVLASGDTPLTYQWRKNGVNLSNGGNVSGATTVSLTISNATAADAGNYDAVAVNPVGSATSVVATLTIIPTNATPAAYEGAILAKNPTHYWRLNEAAASPYAYDYWGGDIATNSSASSGVTGPLPPDFAGLESTNTGNAYDGFTSATDTGISVMNNLGQFTIIGWLNSLGNQPTRTGLFGQNDVTEFGFHGNDANGVAQMGIWTPRGAAYLGQELINPGQWYMVAAVGTSNAVSIYMFTTNGGGGAQIWSSSTAIATTNFGSSGFPFRIGGGGILDATGNYFSGAIDEVATFDRGLSGGELSSLFASSIGVTVLAPQITGQPPGPFTLYSGRSITLPVTAVGSTPLTYQWRKNGVNLSDTGNVSGSATAALTITNLAAGNAGDYDVVVTNAAGYATSIVSTINVISPATGGFEAAVIALNPIALYRFSETNDPSTGTAVVNDYWGGHSGLYGVGSQNGFNGIMGPVPPDFTFETTNTALATITNTLNSYATAPIGSLSTNTVTMCMWIEPTGTFDPFAGLLVNRNAGVAGGFGFTGGQIGYTWNNNNANTYNFRSGFVPPLSNWTFVALTVQPTQAIVYMSDPTGGLLAATNVVAHTADVFGNNWQLGRDNINNNTDAARVFCGNIDEVAVFNYSLTAAQLSSLYVAGGGLLPVSLNIQPSGANVILTWPRGTLLQSDDVTGPWTTNTASSPYSVPASAAKKFYRVIVK